MNSRVRPSTGRRLAGARLSLKLLPLVLPVWEVLRREEYYYRTSFALVGEYPWWCQRWGPSPNNAFPVCSWDCLKTSFWVWANLIWKRNLTCEPLRKEDLCSKTLPSIPNMDSWGLSTNFWGLGGWILERCQVFLIWILEDSPQIFEVLEDGFLNAAKYSLYGFLRTLHKFFGI